MSNETFQYIITGAVVLAFLAMTVQAFASLALYRMGRRMATQLSPVLSRVKAILVVEKDSIRRVEIVIDKGLVCADILERVVPRFGTLAARAESVAARAMPLGVPVSELERSVELVRTSAHFVSLEVRPRIDSIGVETSALVHSAGMYVRRLKLVFHDAFMHFSHLRELIASK